MYSHALKRYAAKVSPAAASTLARDSSVTFVADDGEVTAEYMLTPRLPSACPWGWIRRYSRERDPSSTCGRRSSSVLRRPRDQTAQYGYRDRRVLVERVELDRTDAAAWSDTEPFKVPALRAG